MKKIYLILIVALSLIASEKIIKENNETNSSASNYQESEILLVDARFSDMQKLKYDVDFKMVNIFRDLKIDSNPLKNDLKNLITKIEILKGWGSDINPKSKKILNSLVKILKSKNSYDKKLIEKLETLSIDSALKYS